MRLSILVVACTLAAAPLAAAQPCTHPADRAAFDVASLKSQLMVTALTCDAREKYNDFVLRFRGELMRQEHALQDDFARAFGRRGQQQHDDYITLLANAQSEAGVHDGTLFCRRNAALLDEVLALPDHTKLADYAAAKQMQQPMDLNDCTAPDAQVAHK